MLANEVDRSGKRIRTVEKRRGPFQNFHLLDVIELIKSALGLESVVGLLEGPCVVATGGEDVVELAKVMSELSGGGQQLVIRGGYGEGQALAAEDVRKFTTIPSKPVLIANLLSVMQAPVRNFVGTLNAFARDFVGVLDAVAKKRGEE